MFLKKWLMWLMSQFISGLQPTSLRQHTCEIPPTFTSTFLFPPYDTNKKSKCDSLFLPFFGYEQEFFSYIQLNMKIHTYLQNQNCNSTLETVNIIHSFRRTHCLMRKPSIPTVTAGDTIAQAVISLVNFHILPSVF